MLFSIFQSLSLYVLCLCAAAVSGETVTYDFNITWVNANPDGAFDRSTIGINGKWPIPTIRATVGDRIIVNLKNQLGNQSTSLHFHGLFMNGTAEMDGPVGVTQCPVVPGESFTYNFTVDQPGLYWYHSHDSGQYPDGLRGPLVIEDPDSPHKGKWDEEYILTLSDWYHDQMPGLMQAFISYANPTGAEPVPDAALINDTQDLAVPVEPGKTYFFRVVNMAAFAAQYLWFEGHTMRIIEVDGVWTEEAEAEMLYITAAQRYGVLEELFDVIPDGLNPNVTGWLVYDEEKELPEPKFVDEFDAFDDFTLIPSDGLELFESVDHTITLEVTMDNLGDGANYAFFNDITYVRQKVPTLLTALSAPEDLFNNPLIYGENTNPFVLQKGEVVEIVINNNDPGKHPFHLHGHRFQTVVRSLDEAGTYDPNNETALYDEAPVNAYPKIPMRRDTVLVNPNGNIVIRLRADNPGIWLFHCHIEWHVDSGLVATMIEAPTEFREYKAKEPIPDSHFQACHASNMPSEGNAGGNTDDFLDLSNEGSPPEPLPAYFTAKGIVALVFSVIAAFVGMVVIGWYGAAEITSPRGAATEL